VGQSEKPVGSVLCMVTIYFAQLCNESDTTVRA